MKTIKLSNSTDVAIVSDEDYERCAEYTWFLRRTSYKQYVTTSIRDGLEVKTVYLHRFIANPKANEDVHHTDHEPLNNVRENLKCLDHKLHGYERV